MVDYSNSFSTFAEMSSLNLELPELVVKPSKKDRKGKGVGSLSSTRPRLKVHPETETAQVRKRKLDSSSRNVDHIVGKTKKSHPNRDLSFLYALVGSSDKGAGKSSRGNEAGGDG